MRELPAGHLEVSLTRQSWSTCKERHGNANDSHRRQPTDRNDRPLPMRDIPGWQETINSRAPNAMSIAIIRERTRSTALPLSAISQLRPNRGWEARAIFL